MGTKNNPGKFDCFANAHPDEPMFVLLGRDKDAPALVRAWANERERQGEDPKKVAEARACAEAMERWRVKLDRERREQAMQDEVLRTFTLEAMEREIARRLGPGQVVLHLNEYQRANLKSLLDLRLGDSGDWHGEIRCMLGEDPGNPNLDPERLRKLVAHGLGGGGPK